MDGVGGMGRREGAGEGLGERGEGWRWMGEGGGVYG